MSLLIYHNPACSKSRQTLEILEASAGDVTVVEYLEHPPDAARILAIAGMLGRPVAELLRPKEADVVDAEPLPLDDDEALAAWIARHPRALQRPIVVDDEHGRAVIGRPPAAVTALLQA